MKNYIGIDQYGQVYKNLGKYPRKGLLEQLYASNASKMYQDKKNGDTMHVGYIVGGLWITLYEIIRFEVKQ